MSTWRPMIIDAESSRGIRTGHQTRASRLMRPQPKMRYRSAIACATLQSVTAGLFDAKKAYASLPSGPIPTHPEHGGLMTPPWHKGECLWFREPLRRSPMGSCRYVADDGLAALHWPWRVKTLSSWYMPKWACRGWGLVLAEPVPQQVNALTRAEIRAEGFRGGGGAFSYSPFQWWHNRWVGLHGVESWERNDWIWPIEFEVHDRAWAEAHGWKA